MNQYIVYFIILIIVILIYFFYKFFKKDDFKDKIKSIKELIMLITSTTYLYILLFFGTRFMYHMTSVKAILIGFSLVFMYFSYGLIKNNNDVYKKNINIYIILSIIVLLSITMIIGRPDIKLNIRKLKSISIIPFKSITSFITHNVSFKTKLYNLFGNTIILIPLSFLLMIKNRKYNKIYNQIKIIIPSIILIEIIQQVTSLGSFDIDDIILNISGSIIFVFLITRFNIIDKIRKLFYYDLKLKNKLKYILFFISTLIPIIFIIDSVFLTIKFIIMYK